MEEVNTQFYSSIGPEFYMHLHSLQIQSGKQGWFLVFSYFFAIILPCWLVARQCHLDMGSILVPAVRPGKDHHHMAPKLLGHLTANNYENKPDFLGRRNAQFYKNHFRQIISYEVKPSAVKKLNSHGFSF
uniref:Uncharacterized protein n=1 Tax=Strombidium rassoulzadegani TaxID=1082188 RepID=A0A7S3CJI9_9SPIT|mmetsp:Transcript_13259/g.22501  ORF Transcript_13259/g.22501 Transcript_13259/m.22501 type:complete len:130 (+) Transcript_13259:182-571(+)